MGPSAMMSTTYFQMVWEGGWKLYTDTHIYTHMKRKPMWQTINNGDSKLKTCVCSLLLVQNF